MFEALTCGNDEGSKRKSMSDQAFDMARRDRHRISPALAFIRSYAPQR
jgi:hypothetical protein